MSGPRILGGATNPIFAGVIGPELHAGVTKAEAVAELRAAGRDKFAELVGGMDVVPGQGIDFDGPRQDPQRR